ncbi:MAG TPA: ATP cone domain-containing protein [Patescibacteria group bacterium]|nr:ATP cone domain-containing protein [Patescibacteria group bacterium]
MARKTVTIIKRQGHRESYDERKVYGSVYAACLAAGEPEAAAERIAAAVAKKISHSITDWKVTNSNQVFREVIIELGKLSPKAVFLYEMHRDLS